MIAVRERSGPPAGWIRGFLSLSLLLVAMVGCTDDGNGSAEAGGDTDLTTGATGSTATSATGDDETGSTGGTGTTNATGATGETGDNPPPDFDITLASGCSLQTNSSSFGGPYLLVFTIHLENVGGPYEAETGTVVTKGLPPLSGNSDKLVGYQDDQDVTVGHDLDGSDLGMEGIIDIRAFGSTRGIRVFVPDGLGPARCSLT